MTPTATITIKANATLATQSAVSQYLEEIALEHPVTDRYRYALVDVINTQHDDLIEIYDIPATDGDFVSSTNGTRLLWMPEIGRAALNSYQAGDWQWTDADCPEDAMRRYHEDDMIP